MAKALQSYKSSDKKHLSFPRGASVRGTTQLPSLVFFALIRKRKFLTLSFFFLLVLVVNEEEGMFYGCCNKKVGWFPSYYVKTE
jgi:hypothetical protein